MSLLDGTIVVTRSQENGNLNTVNPIPWEYDTYVRTHYQSYRPPPSSTTSPTKMCEFCERHSESSEQHEQGDPGELHQRYYTCILETPYGQTGIHESTQASVLPLILTDNHRYLAVNVGFATCDNCHYRILEEIRDTLHLLSFPHLLPSSSSSPYHDEPYLAAGKDRNEMLERARQTVAQLTNQEN